MSIKKEVEVFGVNINIRNLLACILIAIILFGCIYIFIKKDNIFKNVVTIRYKSGCEEIYENEVLITEKCPEIIYENKPWMMNLSLNLT